MEYVSIRYQIPGALYLTASILVVFSYFIMIIMVDSFNHSSCQHIETN